LESYFDETADGAELVKQIPGAVQAAETMAFVTLSLGELFRAYTVHSEQTSFFAIGAFSVNHSPVAGCVRTVPSKSLQHPCHDWY